MYPISSSLTSQVQEFTPARTALDQKGFSLGGNWDYDSGSFDCALDPENKIWLRLPFKVTIGNLDSESSDIDTKIRFGEPFVLKHVYKEGLDREAQPRQFMAVFDQFSDPKEPDADIEPKWISQAQRKLAEIEAIYPPD
jgi:hypothetical protein